MQVDEAQSMFLLEQTVQGRIMLNKGQNKDSRRLVSIVQLQYKARHSCTWPVYFPVC